MSFRRALVRSSPVLLVVLGGAIIAIACGDSGSQDEFSNAVSYVPTHDAATDSGGSFPTSPDSGSFPELDSGTPVDASDDADASDADLDAAVEAEASATDDAGNDLTLGAGPLVVAYAGRGLGVDLRPLASFNFAGPQLNAWTAAAPYGDVFNHGTTAVAESGSDTIVGWGLWTAGIATDSAQSFTWPANGGVAYVVGQHVGAVPLTGGGPLTALGGVPTIVSDGSTVQGTATTTAAISYVNGVAYVGLTATLVIGTDVYTLSTTGGPGAPATSELVAAADGTFGHGYPVASASALCGGTCNAQVRGFVSGPTANRVALVIHIYKGAGGDEKTVSTAAAFAFP